MDFNWMNQRNRYDNRPKPTPKEIYIVGLSYSNAKKAIDKINETPCLYATIVQKAVHVIYNDATDFFILESILQSIKLTERKDFEFSEIPPHLLKEQYKTLKDEK